jgi:hypothetical protein
MYLIFLINLMGCGHSSKIKGAAKSVDHASELYIVYQQYSETIEDHFNVGGSAKEPIFQGIECPMDYIFFSMDSGTQFIQLRYTARNHVGYFVTCGHPQTNLFKPFSSLSVFAPFTYYIIEKLVSDSDSHSEVEKLKGRKILEIGKATQKRMDSLGTTFRVGKTVNYISDGYCLIDTEDSDVIPSCNTEAASKAWSEWSSKQTMKPSQELKTFQEPCNESEEMKKEFKVRRICR